MKNPSVWCVIFGYVADENLRLSVGKFALRSGAVQDKKESGSDEPLSVTGKIILCPPFSCNPRDALWKILPSF